MNIGHFSKLILLTLLAAFALQSTSAAGETNVLFDGKTLNGWTVTPYGGQGEPEIKDGRMIIEPGATLSGVHWTNKLPVTNYEALVEVMKLDGSDFFCGLTFPVGTNHCTFVVGGWGGGTVGLSSVDQMDASENPTTSHMAFPKNKWYSIRVKVTPENIECRIDDQKVVEQPLKGHQISLRPGMIELSKPFGVATFQTKAAYRKIEVRTLGPQP